MLNFDDLNDLLSILVDQSIQKLANKSILWKLLINNFYVAKFKATNNLLLTVIIIQSKASVYSA